MRIHIRSFLCINRVHYLVHCVIILAFFYQYRNTCTQIAQFFGIKICSCSTPCINIVLLRTLFTKCIHIRALFRYVYSYTCILQFFVSVYAHCSSPYSYVPCSALCSYLLLAPSSGSCPVHTRNRRWYSDPKWIISSHICIAFNNYSKDNAHQDLFLYSKFMMPF